MLDQISCQIRDILSNYSEDDTLIFNNKVISLDKNNFQPIFQQTVQTPEHKTIAFVDGGQAEILSAGNFCLSFIRVLAVLFSGNKKIKIRDCKKQDYKRQDYKKEFYLLTTARYVYNDLLYENKIFGDRLIEEVDLLISSNDATIKTGIERAPIGKVANMARRFAELALAKVIEADFIVLDGTLEPTFRNEEKFLSSLPENVVALAKSSSLFTSSGNSPVVLLNKIGPAGCWRYFVEARTHFVKLHEKARHVFRFTGDSAVLLHLTSHCSDALFLGYPYGLILADRLARVSNQEKKSLMVRLMLKKENKQIVEYLQAMNAHAILDSIS